MIKAADLFCGAGGTSIGAHQTGEVDVRFALNHWDRAVETHSRNFPRTKHVKSALKWTHPSECEKIGLLFASPECTHHSRARGGKPTSNQQRSGAWEVMPWIEHHRPSLIVVENVVEFEEWGPVGDNGRPLKSLKGKFFLSWVQAIESAGYKVGWRRLNAADFGAATNRIRLFVVAKKGRRAINWPEPTHAKSPSPLFPGQSPWRGASEIIDWSKEIPSIFTRRRPLADKTLGRIEKGLKKHVAPFVVAMRNNQVGHSPESPIGAITPGGRHHGVSVPFITTVNHGESGCSRTKNLATPLGTCTTRNGQAVTCPMIMSPQSGGGVKRTSDPVPTITTMAGSQVITPWISSYYGSQNNSAASSPLPTVTTVDRHSLACSLHGSNTPSGRTDAEKSLIATMNNLGVSDIGFRMLANEELSAAQGFPEDYQFAGNKKEVTKQIGNSVCPPVAKAITEALLE